ncbi:MAG: DUF484 family protein [Thiobacillus sp.]
MDSLSMDAPTMDKQAIADFLTHNPNFFNEFPTLLADLNIPHPHGTHAVSMSERQLIAMRDKVRMLENKLAELIQFGEENDGISEKLHALTLALVSARSMDELTGALALHLREGFAVPHHAMRLLADGTLAADAVTGITTLLQPVCGALAVPQASDWFGEASPHLKSFACIPLRLAASSPARGLLVLASEEDRRFYAGMGTLYLMRLGQILAAALTRMQT